MCGGYTLLFKSLCYIAATADDVENIEDEADAVSTNTVPYLPQFLSSHRYLSPVFAASKAADTAKKGQQSFIFNMFYMLLMAWFFMTQW